MLTAHVVLPGLTSSVPTARHFVESILTTWGHADSAWTGALVVSELAANCALHARTEFTVRVTAAERLRIEVTDSSLRVPLQRAYGPDATTGRGLRMVEQLSAQWGVIPHVGGKTIWAELPQVGADGTDEALVEIGDDLEILLADFDEDLGGPNARTGSPRCVA